MADFVWRNHHMVWSMETSRGREADKIASLVVSYVRGRGLDLGCGPSKVWPNAIGMDSLKDYNGNKLESVDIIGDCNDLSMFSNNSLDFVFSSHLLEHYYPADVPNVLAEWARVIKKGGYMVLYLPSGNLYPKMGTPGANPDHKWDIYPGDVEKILQECTKCGWTQLEKDERSERDGMPTDEYSLFLVFQKRDDGQFVEKIWERNPEGKQRCLVIRYGAIGDQIQSASILPELKKQGYYVTYNCSPPADQVLLHDPHIDEFLLQDKDQVPNHQLGAYWEDIKLRYDKVINLCESVEASLLKIPSRLDFYYSDEARRRLFNVNYHERTHDIAGVPHNFHALFYPTKDEEEWAKKERNGLTAPVIVWAIHGTANHKIYPYIQVVISWLLKNSPAHIYLTGDDKVGKGLQEAIRFTLEEDGSDLSRVHFMSGAWKLRNALTFASRQANVVVGPETGMMNAVGMEPGVAKVCYLSHSTKENLTKHWKNTVTLTSEMAPCYPCHRMHSAEDWKYCAKVEETGAALCASTIKPETVFKAIMDALIATAKKAA
jgi:ADP-heptose:LPS heptosyltransferase/predicted SAM-dependent methyltransferase